MLISISSHFLGICAWKLGIKKKVPPSGQSRILSVTSCGSRSALPAAAMAAAASARPLLGVLGSVCDVTAQVADREVSRQGQVAPDYERWIMQALNDASGPHWMPYLDREPLKCSASASTITGLMQQFLSVMEESRRSSSKVAAKKTAPPPAPTSISKGPAPAANPAALPSRIPPPKASPVKRPCWQESSPVAENASCSPGPAPVSRIPPFVQASPAKRPCWQDCTEKLHGLNQRGCLCNSAPFKLESSPVAENPPCSPGPAPVSRIPPFVQASPAKRPCWQESSPVAEHPPCSPGVATSSNDLPSSGKRIRTQDAASPISERIAQAPSPIRALHFGPAKGAAGEVEDVAPALPGAAVETVPEDKVVEQCEETLSRERAERPTLVFMPSAKPATPGAAPLAAPAAFAQDSIIEPTEEVHVPRPAEWHSKALFEKPPDSPLRRPKAAAPRPKPAELPQASPERKELTPMKVADRIMMFEKIISPSVRCGAGGVAMSSSARLGKALGSANRGSATCSNERSSGRAVDGSSLFTPVQQPWARPDVKPKELFRSTSDLALKPRSKPTEIPRPRAKLAAPPRKPPGAGGHHHGASGIPRGADKENADSREVLDKPGISNLPQKRHWALRHLMEDVLLIDD
eukprot:s2192_g7.t2